MAVKTAGETMSGNHRPGARRALLTPRTVQVLTRFAKAMDKAGIKPERLVRVVSIVEHTAQELRKG